MRRIGLGVGACLVVAVLAGCSQNTPGTPQASDGTTAPSTTKSSGKSSSTPSAPALANLDPCGLLSSEDVARIGTKAGERTGKTCSFKAAGKFSVEITLRPTAGVSELNTKNMEVSPNQVGGHQGQKLLDKQNGVCAIEIAISEKSSVEVSGVATTSGSAEAGCQYATDVANTIEPKLP